MFWDIQIFHQTEKKTLAKSSHGTSWLKKKLCYWHTLRETKIKSFRNKKIMLSEKKSFLKNLYRIGYSKKYLQKKKDKDYLIKAFQRRFRQKLVNGKIDRECLLISKNLLN